MPRLHLGIHAAGQLPRLKVGEVVHPASSHSRSPYRGRRNWNRVDARVKPWQDGTGVSTVMPRLDLGIHAVGHLPRLKVGEVVVQVRPGRIHFQNKADFPSTRPRLQRFLTRDRGADVFVRFGEHQPLETVLLGETFGDAFPVLPYAAAQVAGDAGVEGAVRPVGHDVHPARWHSRSHHRGSTNWDRVDARVKPWQDGTGRETVMPRLDLGIHAVGHLPRLKVGEVVIQIRRGHSACRHSRAHDRARRTWDRVDTRPKPRSDGMEVYGVTRSQACDGGAAP